MVAIKHATKAEKLNEMFPYCPEIKRCTTVSQYQMQTRSMFLNFKHFIDKMLVSGAGFQNMLVGLANWEDPN